MKIILLAFHTLQSGEYLPAIQRHLLPPSSTLMPLSVDMKLGQSHREKNINRV